ncbi:hypothetical protein CCACVL1_28297 [Corchorus capsularis]|uniref:EF-hand domain-containing protein n=1 Tax=Corchorus capsularis TaxID=210143 RepID=A0A1R3G6Z5_COCAP|nr:hypothetical protein CCACVL1_28297 [Corchorus capsularis]
MNQLQQLGKMAQACNEAASGKMLVKATFEKLKEMDFNGNGVVELCELRKMALAYYQVASGQMKATFEKLFKGMDFNDDGEVELCEFMEFMRDQPTIEEQYKSRSFFELLCKTNQKNLDFMDVMTLFYIIQSGRPFCATCAEFIPLTYYCCMQCFLSKKSRYCVCFKCYLDKKYCNHCHPGDDQFLDNFAFLEFCRVKHDSPSSNRPSSSKEASSKIMVYQVPNDEENEASSSTLEPISATPSSIGACSCSKAKDEKEKKKGENEKGRF